MTKQRLSMHAHYESSLLKSNNIRLIEFFTQKARSIGTPNNRALDAGINHGRQWESEQENWEVTGIDFSQNGLNQCTTANDLHHFNINHDSEEWPVKDNSFGLVICTETLHHLDNASKAIETLIKKASPSGVIGLTIPTHNGSIIRSKDVTIRNRIVELFMYPKQLIEDYIEQSGGTILKEHSEQEQENQEITAQILVIQKLPPSP